MNRVEIYRDDSGEYRWRRWTSGQIGEASHQGYARKLTAVEFALKRNLDVPADRFVDLTRGGTVLRSVLVGRILGGAS